MRAFAGFKQTGVDHVRPERMFGRSTNNLLKNIGWAKKGILSFSNTPLNILTAAGTALFAITFLLFPFLYNGLIGLEPLMILLLNGRNLLLFGVLVLLVTGKGAAPSEQIRPTGSTVEVSS